MLDNLLAQITRVGFNIVAGCILIAIFWLFAKFIEKLINRCFVDAAREKQIIIGLLAALSKVSIIIFGVITALGTAGINISAIVASLGLTGFALGFAFKEILSNVLAGILIILYQPFKINQHIEIVGKSGMVESINLRYTALNNNGQIILIPNTIVLQKELTILKPSNELDSK